MRQASTTPLSSNLASRGVAVACAVLMIATIPLTMNTPAAADRFDDQINALRNQMNRYNAQAEKLNKQANSLKAQLNQITAQKNAIEAKIQLNQTKLAKLKRDIAESKRQIAVNKTALGEVLASLYVEGDTTTLEMLASSKNIGDFLDKQTYQSSARDALNQKIDQIKRLEKKLEQDKKEVEKVLADQKVQQASLAAKERQRAGLLRQTKGKEASYRKLVSSTKQQMERVHAEQQAYFASLGSNNAGSVGAFQYRNFSGNMGCGGGYPYCGVMDSYSDPWGLYNRECVSYSAWRATQMGKKVGHFSGQGNAGQWPNSASSWMGATVNNRPAVGAVAILPPTAGLAPIGHSMNVEAILGGGWIRVSQFNFGGTGEYSTMDIQASGVVFVHFPSA